MQFLRVLSEYVSILSVLMCCLNIYVIFHIISIAVHKFGEIIENIANLILTMNTNVQLHMAA